MNLTCLFSFMTKIFCVEMLPAREGDCLWIEYGDSDRPNRILIDGGREGTYTTLKQRFATLPADQREFELLIVTHIDADHIGGVLKMISGRVLPVRFKDVWFNGYHHLPKPPLVSRSVPQAEEFTEQLIQKGLPWNQAFEGKAVVVPDDSFRSIAGFFSKASSLPAKSLAGGMRLTLLSPDVSALRELRRKWDKALENAGLGKALKPDEMVPKGLRRREPAKLNPDTVHEFAETRFEGDTSAANGSSIAVLAEFEGKSALLTGDAHVDVLTSSIQRLGNKPLILDAMKLSHHGSKGTHSKQLHELVQAENYLISTDGSRYGHPDPEALARTVVFGGDETKLLFNYRSKFNKAWDGRNLKARFRYQTAYPSGRNGQTWTAF